MSYRLKVTFNNVMESDRVITADRRLTFIVTDSGALTVLKKKDTRFYSDNQYDPLETFGPGVWKAAEVMDDEEEQ